MYASSELTLARLFLLADCVGHSPHLRTACACMQIADLEDSGALRFGLYSKLAPDRSLRNHFEYEPPFVEAGLPFRHPDVR